MNNQAVELFKILPLNNPQQVRKLLASSNFDINTILPLQSFGNHCTGTALQYACLLNTQNNYLGVIETLLNLPDISVKKESPEISPPLHIAAHSGQVRLARLILAKEPNSSQFQDKFGRTALHCAAANDHTKMMRLLISRGSDINARTQQEKTPLHFAAQRPWYSPIKFLIDKKADISLRDNSNETPFEIFVAQIANTCFRHQIANSFLQATPQRIPYHAFKKTLWISHDCPSEVIDLILQFYYRLAEEKILEIAKMNGIHHLFIKDLCHPKYVDLI